MCRRRGPRRDCDKNVATQVASILDRNHLSASKRYARIGTIANAMDPSLPPRAAPRYLEARLGSRLAGAIRRAFRPKSYDHEDPQRRHSTDEQV
jgi:hypothetical protein